MEGHQPQRVPRGKYARLVCQGCRSRKIKCILPFPDETTELGIPQVAEKSCERCRNRNMECIVERTILGRPSAKHVHQAPISADFLGTRAEQNNYRAESTPTPSVSEIKDYMYSEEVYPGSEQNTESTGHTRPSRQEVFQSMVDPASFFAAILVNNKAFGAGLSHRTLHWDKSLLSFVSEDLAAAMDRW